MTVDVNSNLQVQLLLFIFRIFAYLRHVYISKFTTNHCVLHSKLVIKLEFRKLDLTNLFTYNFLFSKQSAKHRLKTLGAKQNLCHR